MPYIEDRVEELETQVRILTARLDRVSWPGADLGETTDRIERALGSAAILILKELGVDVHLHELTSPAAFPATQDDGAGKQASDWQAQNADAPASDGEVVADDIGGEFMNGRSEEVVASTDEGEGAPTPDEPSSATDDDYDPLDDVPVTNVTAEPRVPRYYVAVGDEPGDITVKDESGKAVEGLPADTVVSVSVVAAEEDDHRTMHPEMRGDWLHGPEGRQKIFEAGQRACKVLVQAYHAGELLTEGDIRTKAFRGASKTVVSAMLEQLKTRFRDVGLRLSKNGPYWTIYR